MAGLALPARRIRRVQARSHHDPPESRRIYGVSGHEMPHVRLSAFLPRNANSGADAQHGRIITCLGPGDKGQGPFRSESLATATSKPSKPKANSQCMTYSNQTASPPVPSSEATRDIKVLAPYGPDQAPLRKLSTLYYYHSATDEQGARGLKMDKTRRELSSRN